MIAITTAPTNLLSTGCFNHFFLQFTPRATCQIIFSYLNCGERIKKNRTWHGQNKGTGTHVIPKIDHALSQLKLELD
jgi:hypothetical protein